MRSLIRRRLPDGSLQEQVLDSVSLTIGRGTDNAVELPGAAVAPRHAKLSMAEPGKYRIESTALTGLEINGIAGLREQDVGAGDKIAIGDNTLTILDPGVNVDLVIEVALAPPQPKVKAREAAKPAPPPRAAAPAAPAPGPARTPASARPTPAQPAAAQPAAARAAPTPAPAPTATPTLTLRDAGIGYRRASWLLAVVVLGLALLLPLVSRGMPEHWPGLLPSDRFWTSGRMSGGHAYFGDQCATCHQALFERVTDAACTSCHTTTKHHSDNPAIRTMAGFEGLRCASCHREHDAVAGLDPPHPDVCTGCHAAPQFAEFPDLAPAADFGDAHPAFRPRVTVRTGEGAFREERRDQTPELRDAQGLIFNHALHLDPAGVRAPDGTRQLACGDCHEPDASRMAFQDLRYARHCEGCHALDAQLGGTTVRLPHADESMMRELLDKYLARAPAAAAPAPAADARRRVGESAERGSPGDLGDEVRRTATRLCAKCHELQTVATGLPRVRELSLRHSWLTHARFTHAEHEAMECARCHGAARSQSAEELLLPTLGDCRTCHAGVDSANGVSSTCIDCHRLHQARLSWSGGPESKGERVSEGRGPQQP